MPLKVVHESVDDIPETYRDLYSERGGKYVLTGVEGVKTQTDIDRLNQSLEAERQAHEQTKQKFSPWAEMDHEDVISKLDKYPELEAAAADKLDDAKIDEIVERRVDGTIKSRTAPIDRARIAAEKERDELREENTVLKAEKSKRIIHDSVREALTKAKVLPEAFEDALMLAERIFEIQEDGTLLTKDQVGVSPGIDPSSWLTEIQDRRPHWWPASQGGGSGGSGNSGGMANNPWSHENWNLTAPDRDWETRC